MGFIEGRIGTQKGIKQSIETIRKRVATRKRNKERNIKMPKLYFMVGLPGCGKTYWIQNRSNYLSEDNTYCLSTDDIIENIAAEYNVTYDDAWDKLIKFASYITDKEVREAIEAKKNVYWDQTNLSVSSRKRKLALFPKDYEKIAVVALPPVLKVWEKRLAREGKTIPDHILENMQGSYEMPTVDEGFDRIIRIKDDTIEDDDYGLFDE